MLDILLLTILTEKDEVERTSALVFLEEHGKSLVWDEESGTDLKPVDFQIISPGYWRSHMKNTSLSGAPAEGLLRAGKHLGISSGRAGDDLLLEVAGAAICAGLPGVVKCPILGILDITL